MTKGTVTAVKQHYLLSLTAKRPSVDSTHRLPLLPMAFTRVIAQDEGVGAIVRTGL